MSESIEQFPEYAEALARRYNMGLSSVDYTWAAGTQLPLSAPFENVQELLFPNSPHERTSADVGILRMHYPYMGGWASLQDEREDRTVIIVGTQAASRDDRKLVYGHEGMTDEQIKTHLLAHELAHVIVFYELAGVLSELFPGQEIAHLAELDAVAAIVNKTRRPLAQMAQLQKYKGDPIRQLYESLPDMLAIRDRGVEEWGQYMEYILAGRTTLLGGRYDEAMQARIRMLFQVVERLYEKGFQEE